MLVSDYVGMVEFFHDVDLLVNVFLKEWLFLDVLLADDLDRVRHICLL